MTRRGFTIMELMTVIGVLALVSLAAGYLFSATVRLNHATGESRNAAAGFDACIEALRADAWSATKIELSGDKEATIATATGKPIVWTIDETGVSRRVEGAPTRRWTLGEGATFAVESVELLVRLPQTKTQRSGVARLPSEVLLLKRETP